jgi:Tol biopolymer transport system component
LSYTLQGNAQITISKLISPAQAQRLTNNNTDDRWPRVSPDGLKVAFFASRDGNTEIYTMGGDGSQQTRITNSANRDEAPTWSPDSRQIIFNSNRDGDHELYIMNADGGNVVQLTNNGVDDGFAVWGQ